MTTLEQAARQALDALQAAHIESLDGNNFACRQILVTQIIALSRALAQRDGPVVETGAIDIDDLVTEFEIQSQDNAKAIAKGRKWVADSVREEHPQQAEPVADAVRGECRLWDSQWTNVVNHADCYRDWNTEDAIRHAVWMTERYMAYNVARNYFPPAQQAEPVVETGEDDLPDRLLQIHRTAASEAVSKWQAEQAGPVADSGNPSF